MSQADLIYLLEQQLNRIQTIVLRDDNRLRILQGGPFAVPLSDLGEDVPTGEGRRIGKDELLSKLSKCCAQTRKRIARAEVFLESLTKDVEELKAQVARLESSSTDAPLNVFIQSIERAFEKLGKAKVATERA